MCVLREGICTWRAPGSDELPLLIDMPSSPVSMSESRSTTSTHESGSKPSVFGANLGLRMRMCSASTPLQ
eukprot:3137090-Prymnesium_polylepis.1